MPDGSMSTCLNVNTALVGRGWLAYWHPMVEEHPDWLPPRLLERGRKSLDPGVDVDTCVVARQVQIQGSRDVNLGEDDVGCGQGAHDEELLGQAVLAGVGQRAFADVDAVRSAQDSVGCGEESFHGHRTGSGGARQSLVGQGQGPSRGGGIRRHEATVCAL